MMQIRPALSLADQIIAQARIAVAYHRLGYGSEFDADVMIRLMDQLGEIVDQFDGDSAGKPHDD
jgi:hypothetical protein